MTSAPAPASTPPASTLPPTPPQPVVRPGILATHILGAVLVQAVQMSIYYLLPIIAIKRFEAKEGVVIVTAAPVFLFVLSIFWNAVFERSKLGVYWIIYWLIACLPIGIAATAHEFATLAACTVVSALGQAAYHPASGEILRRLYPDASRGRVYGIMQTATMLTAAGLTFGMGKWLEHSEDAFRIFLPIAAVLQGLGIIVLWRLAHSTGVEAHRHRRAAQSAGQSGGLLKAAFEPVSHLREVLANDPKFARFQGAYMTYGIGWMICTALLPLLAAEPPLKLSYDQIAMSAHMTYQIMAGLCMIPSGMLLDRLGAARSTSIAFLALAAYPILLLLARNEAHLAISTLYYGMTHAGVSAAWMLGPVAFAPSPSKVPQYVAIHATLVGVRGAIFQGLAVWIHHATGSFTIPFLIASGSLLFAAWQMHALHRRMKMS